MYKKISLVITSAALGLLLLSRADAERGQDHRTLWAAVSVSEPVFEAGGTKSLQINFALANDGRETISLPIDTSEIIVNGEALKDSALILANGPRDARWNALPPGDSLRFGYAMGDRFKEPGIYTVSWKGDGFESPAIVFRVLTNRHGR
jgi:hypothetical protein